MGREGARKGPPRVLESHGGAASSRTWWGCEGALTTGPKKSPEGGFRGFGLRRAPLLPQRG